MTNRLTKHPFTADDIADVQDFDCGDAPYEKEVADWLKGPDDPAIDSALTSIKHPQRPGRVWLYKLDDDLVGFGALAHTEWRWPGKNNDPKLSLSVIIWVAVQRKYWGQPAGARENRYAAQILDDLVAEAAQDANTHPVLGLFVHKANQKAIKFYKNAGFSDELVHRRDKVTNEIEYYKMFIILDDPAFEAAIGAAKKAK
jgi:GNAT superfamily N-acetyltransferase